LNPAAALTHGNEDTFSHLPEAFKSCVAVGLQRGGTMKQEEYTRRVRRRALFLIPVICLFYALGAINPLPTDFSKALYFSVAAGLTSGGIVFVLTQSLVASTLPSE